MLMKSSVLINDRITKNLPCSLLLMSSLLSHFLHITHLPPIPHLPHISHLLSGNVLALYPQYTIETAPLGRQEGIHCVKGQKGAIIRKRALWRFSTNLPSHTNSPSPIFSATHCYSKVNSGQNLGQSSVHNHQQISEKACSLEINISKLCRGGAIEEILFSYSF